MGQRAMVRRSLLWALVAMTAFLGLGWKLFKIQVREHEKYRAEALKMQGRQWPIEAPRGNIYDRNGNPLALNLKLYSVAADPELVDDPAGIAAELGPLLRVPEESLAGTLEASPGVRWVRLQDSVDQPAAEAIRELGCQGLIVNTQWKRAYPHGSAGASVLGFVGRDGEGLEGVEGALDEPLGGVAGEMLVVLDGRLPRSRAQIPERTIVTKPMVPGSSVALTLDLDIQAITEEELAKAVEDADAAGGTAIVMDPETGEVLALASQPGFDPNRYREFSEKSWVNHAVVSPYEPGSTFKVVTASVAIEEGVMSHGETHDCTGTCTIGRRRISCAMHGGSRAHGAVDLDDIVIKSCNTGIAAVAMEIGAERMSAWLRKFGFGEETGIELAGESRGIVAPPGKWSQVQLANIGFGQGIGVTPLQLLSAYCTIANGGWRVRPRVVKAITDASGEIEHSRPPVRQRVLSEETAARMRRVMTDVVEEGTGTAARIPERLVAGKTGTAQKPTPEAGFRSGLYIGSFAGFAPADDPRLAVIVVIDEPRNGHYGGVVAAPAFRAICDRSLMYLRVPPKGSAARISVAMAEGEG